MLHVTPPQGPLDVLSSAGKPFVDDAGFVDVNKFTLRHNT